MILETMETTRKYCSLIHKVRKENNLPITYPLYEAHINSLDTIPLSKAHLNLIAEECNIEWVEPFITDLPHDNVVKEEQDGFVVVVDVTKDHYLERKYQERLEKREKARERKAKGLPYKA